MRWTRNAKWWIGGAVVVVAAITGRHQWGLDTIEDIVGQAEGVDVELLDVLDVDELFGEGPVEIDEREEIEEGEEGEEVPTVEIDEREEIETVPPATETTFAAPPATETTFDPPATETTFAPPPA